MPRIRIKKLPKAAFGLPVQGMQAIQNAANQDIQRQDQIAGRMADQPYYNPFDLKWGQQQQPQVDITGASSNTGYDPYATSTNSSMVASKGSLNLPQLVNTSMLSADPKQNTLQPKGPSFGQQLKGLGMGALKGIGKAGQAVNSVLENPYFQLGAAGVNLFENRQRQKDYKKFERERLFNLNPVGVTERGEFDQNGIFQSDSIGFKGVGTQANAYYPQQGFVEYGGEMAYAAEGMTIEGDRIVQPAFLPDLPPMPIMVPRAAAPSSNVSYSPKNTSSAPVQLSDDFENYAEKAQVYINKVNPNTDISGDMLAAGAQQAYEKYGKVVPVELALAQLQQEGYLAKSKTPNKPQRTKNPFNVGNTDSGAIVDYTDKGLQQGVNTYFNLIAKSYLKNKTPDQLLNNFTNVAGNRYASDKNYESSLKRIINNINKSLPGGDGENTANMKIRIVGTPDETQMAYGGQPPYSGQTDYGLYIGQRNLYKTMAKHPYEDVNNTMSEEEETQENPYVLEAEGGETIARPDGSHMEIVGKRHSEGGVKLTKEQAPEGSFIFSDTAKMKLTEEEAKRFGKTGNKKHTPAAVARQYEDNKYRAILADPNSDDLQKSTAKRMLDSLGEKKAELALVQEGKKGFPQGIPDISKELFEKMTGQSSNQEQPQEMTAMYGGGYKHGGMHGKPGTYPDGYSGTYSNGVYFDYGGALKRFQGDIDGSTVGAPYANAPAYTGGPNPNDPFGLNAAFKQAASRKYTLPNWWEHWTQANTPQGAKSPAHGYPSTYDPKAGNPSYDDYEYWRDRYGKDFEGKTDQEKRKNFQNYMFGELQKGNPGAMGYITEHWGPTAAGRYDDAIFGARTAFGAGSRIPVPQTPPGTSGTPPETKTPPAITTPPGTTTSIKPGEYTPGKSNIPWDYLQQDINNVNAAAMNLALMKKYNMQSRSVQPNLPRFIAQDWRAPAAAAFSTQYAAPMATLSQYSGRQGIGSMASKFAGDAAMNITGNIIPQVAAYNAAGATQTDAQRAQIMNQFAQYNAALRDSDTRENIGLDSKYRFGIGKGIDRLTAAENQKLTNRANMYAMNVSESPDYFYNPRNQRMTFNSQEAMANFMNRNRGGYQDESAANDDMFKRAMKYKEAGFTDAVAASMAGFGKSSASSAPRQRNVRYPGTIANRSNTTMPGMDAYTQPGYGYDYSSMIGG